MSQQSLRILITGAARTIGSALSAELADRGHHVIATARNVDDIEPYQDVRRLQLDVTDDESVAACLAQAGELDVLVDNAALSGAGPCGLSTGLVPLCAGDEHHWTAPNDSSRGSGLAGPQQRCDVNVSRVQGRVGTPIEGPYCASKFALEGLSETLHYELGHFGICRHDDCRRHREPRRTAPCPSGRRRRLDPRHARRPQRRRLRGLDAINLSLDW